MKSRSLIVFAIPLLVLLSILFGSLFVVQQTQQALVLEFGKLIRVIKEPGFYVKIPFLQTLRLYDNRILDFDLSSIPATLGDQKTPFSRDICSLSHCKSCFFFIGLFKMSKVLNNDCES
jgi:Membrane protease subunits, stomatin/prohibitin homologs